jgi:hypothetical protein
MGKAKGLKKKKTKLKWTLTLLTLTVRAYSVYLTVSLTLIYVTP